MSDGPAPLSTEVEAVVQSIEDLHDTLYGMVVSCEPYEHDQIDLRDTLFDALAECVDNEDRPVTRWTIDPLRTVLLDLRNTVEAAITKTWEAANQLAWKIEEIKQ